MSTRTTNRAARRTVQRATMPATKPMTSDELLAAVIANLSAFGLGENGKPVSITRANLLEVLDAVHGTQVMLSQKLSDARRKRMNAMAALTED